MTNLIFGTISYSACIFLPSAQCSWHMLHHHHPDKALTADDRFNLPAGVLHGNHQTVFTMQFYIIIIENTIHYYKSMMKEWIKLLIIG